MEARDGGLYLVGKAGQGETYAAILQKARQASLEAEASSGLPLEMLKDSMARSI